MGMRRDRHPGLPHCTSKHCIYSDNMPHGAQSALRCPTGRASRPVAAVAKRFCLLLSTSQKHCRHCHIKPHDALLARRHLAARTDLFALWQEAGLVLAGHHAHPAAHDPLHSAHVLYAHLQQWMAAQSCSLCEWALWWVNPVLLAALRLRVESNIFTLEHTDPMYGESPSGGMCDSGTQRHAWSADTFQLLCGACPEHR